MTIENRIRHLEEEHAKLDKKINGLESTGVFGDTVIIELKKQRLRIKTELVTLIQEHREPVYKTEIK